LGNSPTEDLWYRQDPWPENTAPKPKPKKNPFKTSPPLLFHDPLMDFNNERYLT
jgi:hypothetical protein